jgi:hypothetical protein
MKGVDALAFAVLQRGCWAARRPLESEVLIMPEVTDEELEQLQAAAARASEFEAELGSLRESAGADLRAAVVAGRPDLPADLITGSTAEELRASVEHADGIVSGIREATLEQVRGLASGKQAMGFRPGGGGSREPRAPPEGVRGMERLRWALESEGSK